jgi:RNA polymerase sigma-70 factor (ECF subfamily)
VRNKTIAALRRRRPGDCGTGDTGAFDNVESRPIEANAAFELEVRRAAFEQAADRVRPQVQTTSWEAFWRTSVLGHSIQETARALGISIGSVYAARSRILARLRTEADAMLEDGV